MQRISLVFQLARSNIELLEAGQGVAEDPSEGVASEGVSNGAGSKKRRSKTPEAADSETKKELKRARHIMRHLEAKMKAMEEEQRARRAREAEEQLARDADRGSSKGEAAVRPKDKSREMLENQVRAVSNSVKGIIREHEMSFVYLSLIEEEGAITMSSMAFVQGTTPHLWRKKQIKLIIDQPYCDSLTHLTSSQKLPAGRRRSRRF